MTRFINEQKFQTFNDIVETRLHNEIYLVLIDTSSFN